MQRRLLLALSFLTTLASAPAAFAADLIGQASIIDGDTIEIPVHSAVVMVTGAVNSPVAVPYVKGAYVDYYVYGAGGPTAKGDLGRAYVAQPGGMRAGFEYFRSFERDAKDFAQLSSSPLPMPMLVLTGEKASGQFLIQQGRLVATNVEGVVITNSGHWLMEEAPEQVIPKLVEFLNR